MRTSCPTNRIKPRYPNRAPVVPVRYEMHLISVTGYNEQNDTVEAVTTDKRAVTIDAGIFAVFIAKKFFDSPHDMIGQVFYSQVVL